MEEKKLTPKEETNPNEILSDGEIETIIQEECYHNWIDDSPQYKFGLFDGMKRARSHILENRKKYPVKRMQYPSNYVIYRGEKLTLMCILSSGRCLTFKTKNMKNETFKEIEKAMLKEELSKCTSDQQLLFKRMYCHKNLEMSINDCVDQMPDDKIDWAFSQVQRTLQKAGI